MCFSLKAQGLQIPPSTLTHSSEFVTRIVCLLLPMSKYISVNIELYIRWLLTRNSMNFHTQTFTVLSISGKNVFWLKVKGECLTQIFSFSWWIAHTTCGWRREWNCIHFSSNEQLSSSSSSGKAENFDFYEGWKKYIIIFFWGFYYPFFLLVLLKFFVILKLLKFFIVRTGGGRIWESWNLWVGIFHISTNPLVLVQAYGPPPALEVQSCWPFLNVQHVCPLCPREHISSIAKF